MSLMTHLYQIFIDSFALIFKHAFQNQVLKSELLFCHISHNKQKDETLKKVITSAYCNTKQYKLKVYKHTKKLK